MYFIIITSTNLIFFRYTEKYPWKSTEIKLLASEVRLFDHFYYIKKTFFFMKICFHPKMMKIL